MSKNAATGAGWEDLPTKALNRGTEDVDDGNIRRKDPRTSLEASAKGNSAESAGTTVLLESEPHKTRNVVMHQMCLVLWTWRKLADETNAKNAPKIC